MSAGVNIYGLKFFILALIIFSFLSIEEYFFKVSLLNLNGFIYILLFDVAISIISLLFIEDIDPVMYYLLWYWVSISSLLLPDIPYFSGMIRFSLLYLILIPLIFSAVFGTIFLVSRHTAGTVFLKNSIMETENSNNRRKSGTQSIRMSFLYAVLIIMDVFTYRSSEYYFLKPYMFITILALCYIVSFVYVFDLNPDSYNGINLGVFGIFFISILPFVEYNWHVASINFIILLIIMVLASIVGYLIIFREMPGGVGSSYEGDLIVISILLIVWSILNLYMHSLGINLQTFLFILLPISIGSVISDSLHGHHQRTFGVVGGLSIGDGLWYPIIICIILYLAFNIYFLR